MQTTFLDSTPLSPELLGLTTESFLKVRRFIIESGDRAFSSRKEERGNVKEVLSDITTKLDVSIETEFASLVKSLFPTHGFLGEEDASLNHQSEYSWYIDPIDGTHYFSNGVPLWSVAIALVHQDKPIIGLIYNPSTGDLYEAQEGHGTYLNSERLPLLTPPANSRGRFFWDYDQWQGVTAEKQEQLELLYRSLKENVGKPVTFYSGSLALAFLSQGAFAAFVDPYRRKIKFVDIAAGLLMASEVGCAVHRKSLTNDAEEVIVGSPDLVAKIGAAIDSHTRESKA